MKRSQIDPAIFHEVLLKFQAVKQQNKLKLLLLDYLKDDGYKYDGKLIRVYLFKPPKGEYGYRRYRFSIVYANGGKKGLRSARGLLTKRLYKKLYKRAEQLN